MQTPPSPADAYTIAGLLLSLVGLLATFYSVQLSQWLMNLLALRAKWNAHKTDQSEESKAARRECRAEIGGMYNPVPALVTLALAVFITFIILSSFSVLDTVSNAPFTPVLRTSLWAFVYCYGILTIGLLTVGYSMGCRLKSQIS